MAERRAFVVVYVVASVVVPPVSRMAQFVRSARFKLQVPIAATLLVFNAVSVESPRVK